MNSPPAILLSDPEHATTPADATRHAGSTSATVYIVDDDPAACSSVAALADSLGLRSATFPSAEAFLAAVTPDAQGCLVTDLRLPGISGLDLLLEATERGMRLPIILISAFADVPIAVRAMQRGAVTLLEKPCRDSELGDAIRQAMSRQQQHQDQQGRRQELQALIDRLSLSEREVLAGLVAGKANKTIAAELQVSLRTVESRRHNVMNQMGARSLAELVRLVIESGVSFSA